MAGLNPDQLGRLLRSGDYSDWRITCQGREWKVHRAIISQASEFFRVSCEKDFKEKEHRRSDFPNDDPDAVEVMLNYIYLGEFIVPDSFQTAACTIPAAGEAQPSQQPSQPDAISACDKAFARIAIDVRVYLLADRLDMPELKTEACKHFTAHFDPLVLTREGFPAILSLVYEGTTSDDNLRFLMTKECVKAAEEVQKLEEVLAIVKGHEWVAFCLGREKDVQKATLQMQYNEFERQIEELRASIPVDTYYR